MTFTRVARTVRSDTAEVFVGWNLVEEVRKHWGITYAAGRYFNCAYLQCFFIDPYVYLTPKATFGTTMFARIPLTFTLCFDARAVDKQVQEAR